MFNKYVLELSSATTEVDNANQNQLPDGLYLLYLINQMCGNPYNAKMIMQYEYTMLMQPIKVNEGTIRVYFFYFSYKNLPQLSFLLAPGSRRIEEIE